MKLPWWAQIRFSSDPGPLCPEILREIGSFGVSSDNFSFYDSNHEELSASGNGGMRQMYNYSGIEQSGSNEIYTPQDQGKEQKLSMSMEQIQQRRNNEI